MPVLSCMESPKEVAVREVSDGEQNLGYVAVQ